MTQKLFSQSSLWIVNLCLKSYTFCLHFIFECVDPDPYWKYVRIRITKLLNKTTPLGWAKNFHKNFGSKSKRNVATGRSVFLFCYKYLDKNMEEDGQRLDSPSQPSAAMQVDDEIDEEEEKDVELDEDQKLFLSRYTDIRIVL